MEKSVMLLVPALLALILVRLLLMPLKLVFKLGIHSPVVFCVCGF